MSARAESCERRAAALVPVALRLLSLRSEIRQRGGFGQPQQGGGYDLHAGSECWCRRCRRVLMGGVVLARSDRQHLRRPDDGRRSRRPRCRAAAASIQVSDAQGQFRLVGVYPGTYKLEGNLEGFSPVVYPSLIVNLNRNTTVALVMNAAVAETITITAESPLLDARKISTGATIDKTELEKIPSARDPWVILQTTPGVLVDRVNVGGNESGQQSTYTGNGDDGTNATWSIDGVEITDFGAIGSSASYYDFDAFEELQVTTGGSDATSRTGGVGLNLVTKRGTNEWRGSGRYIVAQDDWQSDFNASTSATDFDGAGHFSADHPRQNPRMVK
jgi:hypothetical protein